MKKQKIKQPRVRAGKNINKNSSFLEWGDLNIKNIFCHYCECMGCINGASYLTHALTIHDDFICDVCYDFELCINANRKFGIFSSECNEKCAHRPLLLTDFEK